MKFVCDECGTQYLISDEKVGPKGAKVRCKRCGNIIIVRPIQSGQQTAGTDPMASMTEPQGRPLDDSEPSQEQDELGQAFDQLLKGGLDAGEDDEADEDEGQATEIFSMDELQRLRTDKAIADEEQDKIDQVFSEAASTGVGNVNSGSDESDREEWYVAINDEQVGPMGLGEVETRWESGEITPDSLAWHPGMSDWIAVKDAPKLRYLLGSMKKEVVPSAVEDSDSFSAKASDKWDTSGSSALSSLVEEEIESISSQPPVEEEEIAASSGESILDEDEVPPWEREEVVSGEVARPSESYFDSTLDSPTTDSGAPIASRRSGFSRPAYLSGGTEKKSKTKWIVVASLAVVVVAGAAFAIFGLSGNEPSDRGKVQPIDRPKQDGSQGKSGTDSSKAATAKDAGVANASASPANKDGQAGKNVDDAKKAEGVLVVKKAGTTPAVADSVNTNKKDQNKGNKKGDHRKKRKKKKKKVTTVTGQKTKVKSTSVASKQAENTSGLPVTLNKEQIFGTMKKYLSAMKGCVKQQLQRNPSVKGTMLVSFVILGSGKAGDVRIISKEHQGTYVAGCMTYLIKNMKFPKFSGSSIPIPRIPLKLGE